MLAKFILLLTISLAASYPKDAPTKNKDTNQRPYLYLLNEPIEDQAGSQQIQSEDKGRALLQPQQVSPQRQQIPQQSQDGQQQPQQMYQPNGYGIQYLEPQFNYQAFPRVQPSFLLYGAGGQGQPILINPGSPPGNFLVPQQPGTNVFLRGNPQNPYFIGGYPNPTPAHIPPIEKDAEEVPTNPSNIPPLASADPQERKPEKLETFTEDYKPEQQAKTPGEAEVLAEADRTPKPLTRNNLRPGQRFFILNGEPLYQNYPNNYQEDPNLGFQQIDQPFQQLQDGQQPQYFNYNAPVPGFLLRNVPDFNQQPNYPLQGSSDLNQQNLNRVPNQNDQRFTQSFIPLGQNLPQEASLRGNLPNLPELVQLNGRLPQDSLFRTNLENNNDNRVPIGQFRFAPPNGAFFPFEDDPENDSVVVDANFDDSVNDGQKLFNQEDISLPVAKSSDPSTAQATPGAIALAGPGGVAGAAPKATALAGKGGLAVSSPKATAIAGTREEEKTEKETKVKQDKEKKPTRKPKN